jgi:glycosyltransferase involved in cell wall biosynthesis
MSTMPVEIDRWWRFFVARSVMIDGRLIGYRYGGIATYARQLATRLPAIARELDVRLVLKHESVALSDRSVRAITPPHHRWERYLFGLEATLRGPDLLHSVDYVQPVTWNVANVVTIHDLAFLNNPALVTPESRRYYEQILHTLPHADRVIAVSEWTRSQLVDIFPGQAAKTRVVPNGFDPAVIGPANDNDCARLAALHPELSTILNSERPIVLAVGTIEPRKRFHLIADAFERHFDTLASHSGTSPVLIVAGQAGWLSESVINQIRSLHRQNRAIWIRDINDRELASLYRRAKLLVMPSADEGFGLPALEAMASGTPALVSDVGALPGLVGDCGFIETSDNAGAWAEKIGRILADQEILDRRAIRGIDRAASYSWEATARQTLEVYREVLSEQ